MKNKIVLLLSCSLSIIFLISCGGGQKENVQEAKINTQGKKFVCVSTTSLIYDTSNEEEPVEEDPTEEEPSDEPTEEESSEEEPSEEDPVEEESSADESRSDGLR